MKADGPKNPFRGMNPYLERHWGDVHHRLVTYAADQLNSRLPRGLRARIDRRDTAILSVDPNISVSEPLEEGMVVITEPAAEGRVVTIVDFLTATPMGYQQSHGVHRRLKHNNLVEINLLRSPHCAMMIPESQIPYNLRAAYRIALRPKWEPASCEFYPVPLRDRLPIIRVPLRAPEEHVLFELQPIIDHAYRNGGYDDIDYKSPPEPPLDAEDAAWADELLKSRGLR